MTTTYTAEQISSTPDNHVYDRIPITPELDQKISDLKEYQESYSMFPGLHIVRAFHGILYRANSNMVLGAWNRLQMLQTEEEVAVF